MKQQEVSAKQPADLPRSPGAMDLISITSKVDVDSINVRLSGKSATTMNDRSMVRPCKLCSSPSRIVFGLPHNKKAGHPIPDEPDDCWYFQCPACNFLFTDALDDHDHTKIYDEAYWTQQDPDWYGRVSETLRLVLLSNELLHKQSDQLDILDFGCGSGSFIEMGHRSLQLNVWGTDIIEPKVGKEHFLPTLGDRRFDVITACEVIEHLPEPRKTFDLIRSHLKSPGVFAFQTAQWDPRTLGRDWWYLGPHNGHISLYSKEGLDYVFAQMKGARRRSWRNYPGIQAWLFTGRRGPRWYAGLRR